MKASDISDESVYQLMKRAIQYNQKRCGVGCVFANPLQLTPPGGRIPPKVFAAKIRRMVKKGRLRLAPAGLTFEFWEDFNVLGDCLMLPEKEMQVVDVEVTADELLAIMGGRYVPLANERH
ncbi:MAG: hypothetical protein EBR82_07365 [Caulobacteraceae bacterium]|nr:hypothetical protein [Caulobacteraceae bacterium]